MKKDLLFLIVLFTVLSTFAQQNQLEHSANTNQPVFDSPCQSFTISLDTNLLSHPLGISNTIKSCSWDTITLAAKASFPNNDMNYNQTLNNTTFIWQIGNNPQDTALIIHKILSNPIGTHFKLFAYDINGCISSNTVSGLIINTTNPIISSVPAYEISMGEQLLLTASEEDSTFLQYLPVNIIQQIDSSSFNNTNVELIPDGYGSYISYIIVQDYPENQLIQNIDQIIKVHFNIEHSRLGDLTFRLMCPSGESVVLKAYNEFTPPVVDVQTFGSIGGGSKNLGMAPDPQSSNNCYMTEGVGWDYEFRPGAIGAFGEGSTVSYNYTDSCGNNWAGPSLIPSVLPSGITSPVDPVYYGSYENMSKLIGCPLNGFWSIRITDAMAVDNGYIFNWGIEFSDTIPSQNTIYTVAVDSVLYYGPNIQQLDSYSAQINGLNSGGYPYEVKVVDEFGCNYFRYFAVYCELSIEDQNDQNIFSFYPNPAENYINCKIMNPAWENSVVEIYSITGQLIHQVKLNGIESNINVASLTLGTYLLKVTNSQKDTQTFKLVKR